MSAGSLPRYRDLRDVPRDLRPEGELTARGYRDLGPVCALLDQGNGVVALYSTTEARRRRDSMWPRSTPVERPPAGRTDLVASLADGSAPAPGRPLAGTCQACGEARFGLVDGVCPSCRRQQRERTLRDAAGAFLERLFEDDFVILDTETTGLGRRDEIIELGVVAASGATLLQTLVYPHGGRVPSAASRIHGLTIDDLEGAPSWPEVLPELRALVAGRRVLAWNAPFDERMVQQSSGLWRVRHGLPAFECAMRAYTLATGVAGGRRKLAAAAAERGLLDSAQKHRSAEDARLTLAVLRSLVSAAG